MDEEYLKRLLANDFLTTPISSETAAEVLNILAAREGKGATVVTSQFDPEDWARWEPRFRMACEYSPATNPYWNQEPPLYVTQAESDAEDAAVAARLVADPGYGTRGENNVPDSVALFG